MSYNNKVIKYYGKINLKDYISSFIKNQKQKYENCKFLKSLKKRDINSN